ncbi:hypothetical protein NC796_23920 [Aliifodinibius sp. S!AR15-10]|uniref:hypothetical protein n=1 Tax=Aliifodinibius sp. S!AR15-10 TaxID=2950437 RepID=UPI00285F9502|nr:hypothetical protein [Aliifodinibius sp. S!AR15-10]MDR8394217.1 hypothetical protein [Aliifodinibius sp. S!AR15-10]
MQPQIDTKEAIMKRSGFQFLFLLIIALLLSTNELYAQQGGDAQSSLLPEIDPQDIEIRSEFRARFPGLRRQPILGFNPKPSVYQVDPDRQPFMETQEEVVANLPITDLSRPAAPEYRALYYEPEINAFSRAGVGSFVSPEIEFWGVSRFSENSYAGGQMDYHSSNGHLETENSSFRFFDADGEFATKLSSNVALKLNGGLENSFNRLFELEGSTAPLQVPSGPRKNYTGLNAGIGLDQHTNSIEGWNADIDVRWFNMDMNAGDIGGSATESILNASFGKVWAGNNIQETYGLQASFRGGSYDLSSQNSENWMTLRAGAEYDRLLDYSTQITANADFVYASNAFEDKVYPGFQLKAKHWMHNNLIISAHLSGDPKLQSIEQLHNLNRFLNYRTEPRHTYTIEAGGGIDFEYFPGSTMYASVSYMQAQNYAYFSRASLSSITSADGYYIANYRDANKIKGEAGIIHQLVPDKFWINAKAYVQQPKFNNGDDIPYEESWGINSGASAKLLDRFRIEAWADYVSKRNTLSSTTVDGFFLVGGQLDVDITDKVGVYVKMMNLLSQEYEIWSGYEERPFQAYGGVTIKLN